MKIKSIAAICKKNKNIAIFERYSDDGDILTQYIGDGSAVYPVIGLPPLDAESLLTIFDVPEKDRDNYFVKTLGIPAGISFEDTDATERQVEREGISIIYSGRTLKPIHTTRGLVFIESRYLAPVADVLDVLELYERRTTDGAPYIVAKAGFLLQSECASCGWEAAEAARRREYMKEHGLTLCADGFRRLIIKKENDMATPYKECPHCGAHLDSGEKCDCRAAEADGNAEKELKERTKDNDN